MNNLGTDNLLQATERFTKMLATPAGLAYVQGVSEGGADTPTGLAALIALKNKLEPPVEAPESSVADRLRGSGLPSVAPQQNNQDPRLMAGMGGMNINPVAERASMDTPISGIAQLPAQQMMADGGIVGFANTGFVENPRGRNRQSLSDYPNTADIPPEDMEPETYMTMRDMEEFENLYGYRPTRNAASTTTKRGSIQQLMESERPLTRGVGSFIDSASRGFGLFDDLSMPQSPRQLAEPAEIAKELKRRDVETSIPIEDEATVAATKKRNPSFQSIRDVIAGTQGGREGYLEKRTREGLILDKREKEARAAAEKAAAKKAAEEKAAAEKIAAEKRAKELAVEKAARKKRQRESGRDLLATSAAMLRAAEEGKSTFGVLGAGAEGREAALSRREAAEVAATEAESVQGARSDEILIKQMAAQAALSKVGLDQQKAVLEYLSTDATGMSLTAEADRILAAKEALTFPDAMDKAVGNVLTLLRNKGLIGPSIGAAPITASPQDFTGFKKLGGG